MSKIQSNIQEAKEIRNYLNQSISKIKEDLNYESIEDKIKQYQMYGSNMPIKPRITIKIDKSKHSNLNLSSDQLSPKLKKGLGMKKITNLNITSY